MYRLPAVAAFGEENEICGSLTAIGSYRMALEVMLTTSVDCLYPILRSVVRSNFVSKFKNAGAVKEVGVST